MTPLLYPAIDLLEGRAVRLQQGDRKRSKVYSDDPAALARSFVEQGARALHVVDLDAAFGGTRQVVAIRKVVEAAGAAMVQVGGGIRSVTSAEETLGLGAGRVVLGTSAIEEPAFAGRVVAQFGAERVAAGIDIKEGRAATKGWTETRGPPAGDLAAALVAQGVRWMVVTAVSRDGMQEGFDLPLLHEVSRAAPEARIVASGGAGALSHLAALAAAGIQSIAGAIAGTALYEGKFTLREGQAALEGPSRC
jgi:phosphoribosylformimino-5-aminoimidazole carboxamide ribotide isomerase